MVTRSVVSASMDMGVGHSGIVKLCRYLDMNAITHTTYVTLKSVIAETACNVWTKLLRSYAVYIEADQYLADAKLIDLTVSYDGS